jgi:hypothetical protein
MNNYRFKLEPYKGRNTRHTCPQCRHPNEFTRYFDTRGEICLPDYIGICNRVNKCGYHVNPGEYLKNKAYTPVSSMVNTQVNLDVNRFTPENTVVNTGFPGTGNVYMQKITVNPNKPDTDYISDDVYQESIQLNNSKTNHLIQYLTNVIGDEQTTALVHLYRIGTSTHWPGATIFWQIDEQAKIHSGKIMVYDPFTGKRIRKPYAHIAWVHSQLVKTSKISGFNLEQCLFGLHLINNDKPFNPIGIVESEKTAIIASAFLPELTWLATGGIGNLNNRVLKPLAGRKIIIYPDKGGMAAWRAKVDEIGHITGRQDLFVSSRVESLAGANGMDLADFLILI